MKLGSIILVISILIGITIAQKLEITPLYEVGMQDITFGGATLKSKTLLGGRTSLFHFGGGVRINQKFGAMLGLKAIKVLGLSTEGLKKDYISYIAVAAAPISITALWFPKPEARTIKPFVFLSFNWLHTMIEDHAESNALTDEFPRSYISIGAGYTIYSITPHIQFEFIPAWEAISYSLGFETGGIFDW